MMRHQQQGVALITALLVVTLAATAAVSITGKLQLDIRRTGNIINRDQAYMYALAAEDFARYGLRLDRQASKTDHLNELWALVPVAEEIEGGHLQGKLEDLQGRFNLNNLASGKDEDKQRFERLLKILEFDDEHIKQLTASLIDWMDSDQTSQVGYGAEDDYYMGLALPALPHVAANSKLSSLSELRLLKGFDLESLVKLRVIQLPDPETGELLSPLFTVLPDYTGINVNTASAEVLRSLHAEMSEDDAQQIIIYRDGDIEQGGDVTPFENVEDFVKYVTDTLKKPNLSNEALTVSTDYFLVNAQAVIDRGHMNIYSILFRDDKGFSRVVSRGQGVL